MLKTICNEICCSIYILIKFNYRSIPIFSAKVVKGFGFMLKSIDCISQRKKMDALNYPFWKEVILPTTIIANGYFPSALNVKLWKIVFIEKIRALLWCDKPLQTFASSRWNFIVLFGTWISRISGPWPWKESVTRGRRRRGQRNRPSQWKNAARSATTSWVPLMQQVTVNIILNGWGHPLKKSFFGILWGYLDPGGKEGIFFYFFIKRSLANLKLVKKNLHRKEKFFFF